MSGLLINGLSTREGRRPTHECRYRSCSSLSGFSRGAVLVYRHALVALRHRIREFLSIRQDACQSWTADSCIGRGDRQKRNLRVGWEGIVLVVMLIRGSWCATFAAQGMVGFDVSCLHFLCREEFVKLMKLTFQFCIRVPLGTRSGPPAIQRSEHDG